MARRSRERQIEHQCPDAVRSPTEGERLRLERVAHLRPGPRIDRRFEQRILRAARRRYWAGVDAAIRWAVSDSTSPQAMRGIDPAALQSGGGGSDFAEVAADRAQIQAAIGKLDVEAQAIVVGYAFFLSYRDLADRLREAGIHLRMASIMAVHRAARERIRARLAELGYLE